MSELLTRRVRSRCLPVLVLAVAVWGAYANHFHNAFQFDDSHTVVENPNIRSLRNFPRFFTDPGTLTVLPTNRSWRPLVTTSLAIDYWLGKGLNPFWFQLSTFLWFLVQVCLMFFLFARLFEGTRPDAGNPYVALFGAALYGLHPACAETVNYVNQRAEVYSTLGVVAGLYLYIARPSWRKFGVYLILVAAGLLSKPPALVFPAILFLYARLFEERSAVRCLRAVLPSLGLSVLFGALQAAMTPATFMPGAASAAAYRATQPYVALRYFISFFLPVRLSADTGLRPFSNAAEPAALAGFAFLAALAWAAWNCSRRRDTRPAGFGLWWFLIALAPTSLFPLAEVENDHRMFFPFVGLSMSVAWMLGLLWWRLKARMAGAVPVTLALAVLAAFGYGVHLRNQVWHDDVSLWRDVTIKSPHNGRGLMNYGTALMGRGDLAGALNFYNRALAYSPDYDFLEVNLGIVNGGLHRDGEAERHFERAIALAPRDAMPHFYFGRWLEERGRTAEALKQAQTALALNPAEPGAAELLRRLETARPANTPQPRTPEEWLALSLTYYSQQKYLESVTAAQTAAALRPGYAEAYNNVGAAYAALHLWDAAIQADLQAIRLKPNYQLARNNLAWARQQKRLGVR